MKDLTIEELDRKIAVYRKLWSQARPDGVFRPRYEKIGKELAVKRAALQQQQLPLQDSLVKQEPKGEELD